ncbi:glucosamine inositolphosphorylceramide transferase family protein [Butyricicoccus porcorum]|uniref:glucosamine inositolphosphorylceramide transferase family protein n=1 Tax=Butyricicoccus porcorum TaxID=1945634 RepID=UPI003F4AB974
MKIQNTPLFAESWNAAYRKKSIGTILEDHDTPFHIIKNSSRFWAADTMVYEYNGETYLFAELYDYKLCRGTLGVALFDGIQFGAWKQIIVEPFHLSYPLVFERENCIYMLPETSEVGQLRLYKAVQFPYKWELYKVIKDGVHWVDTTLFKQRDIFIGFTQSLDGERGNLRFELDQNFDIYDIQKLPTEKIETYRNGGRFFELPDGMIRVCQDCVDDYGAALFFRKYDNHCHHELKNIHISPQDLKFDRHIFLQGMHTYTATDKFEVIDVKTRRLNLINLFFRLKNKIYK